MKNEIYITWNLTSSLNLKLNVILDFYENLYLNVILYFDFINKFYTKNNVKNVKNMKLYS